MIWLDWTDLIGCVGLSWIRSDPIVLYCNVFVIGIDWMDWFGVFVWLTGCVELYWSWQIGLVGWFGLIGLVDWTRLDWLAWMLSYVLDCVWLVRFDWIGLVWIGLDCTVLLVLDLIVLIELCWIGLTGLDWIELIAHSLAWLVGWSELVGLVCVGSVGLGLIVLKWIGVDLNLIECKESYVAQLVLFFASPGTPNLVSLFLLVAVAHQIWCPWCSFLLPWLTKSSVPGVPFSSPAIPNLVSLLVPLARFYRVPGVHFTGPGAQ